jgi:hypothetical protein
MPAAWSIIAVIYLSGALARQLALANAAREHFFDGQNHDVVSTHDVPLTIFFARSTQPLDVGRPQGE